MNRFCRLELTFLLFAAFLVTSLFACRGSNVKVGREEEEEQWEEEEWKEEWDDEWEEEGAEHDEDGEAVDDAIGHGADDGRDGTASDDANDGRDVKATRRSSCGKRFHEQDFYVRGRGEGGAILRVGGAAEIVNGKKAVKGAYPWQVLILGSEECGGTIIDDRHIITAAHCLYSEGRLTNPDILDLVVGEHSVRKDEASEQWLTAEWIAVHEKYDEANFNNDIGIIKTMEPIRFGEFVQPACLPAARQGRKLYKKGRRAFVSGWGSVLQDLGDDVKSYPDVLQATQVIVGDSRKCRKAFRTKYHDALTRNMFCAGYYDGSTDACQGDSGGPLVVKYYGRFYLAGIVSWGVGCAVPGTPGVYTKVINYLKWIRDQQTLER